MRHASRIVLYALLALMQVLSPWVHAHTGSETGGFLHLPGLEFLAKAGKGCTADERRAGDPGLIVGVQAGARNVAEPIAVAADRYAPADLPRPACPSGRLSIRTAEAVARAALLRPGEARRQALPRAPPGALPVL